jgi:hypothetical protein
VREQLAHYLHRKLALQQGHVQVEREYRRIPSTLIYTRLASFEKDEYCVTTAKTLKEDEELLSGVLEYVTWRDGIKTYRKRK